MTLASSVRLWYIQTGQTLLLSLAPAISRLRKSSTQVQFSCSVVSNSLSSHGLQHARPPCPSPTPRVCSDSCPSSRWCHLTISSALEISQSLWRSPHTLDSNIHQILCLFLNFQAFAYLFSYIPYTTTQTTAKLMVGLKWISTNYNLTNSYKRTVNWATRLFPFDQ